MMVGKLDIDEIRKRLKGYRVESVHAHQLDNNLEDFLNELYFEGWQLDHIIRGGETDYYIFKRIPNKDRPPFMKKDKT